MMAFLLIALSLPVAFAATPISLKATNVTVWPTAVGEIYYGQKLGEHITFTGGEVQYNGVVVPGHFEHADPDASPEEAMEGYEADIKFVPDDTSAYKGFTKYYSKTTFNVNKTTPVLADETKPPVVNDVVDPGVKLSSVAITDGAMVNPYDVDESYAKKAVWKWSNPDTVVSESGYYEAKFSASSIRYVAITQNIWVEVNNPIPISIIEELPTIETFNYNPSITWEDVEIKGGKAVIENDDGTTTEINGVFSFSNENLLKKVPSVGTFELDVIFTPENSEEALPSECKIPVTVNKAPIRFVDENGNDIVPEITVPYGTKFNDISRLLRPYVKGAYYTYFVMGDLSSKVCEDGTYTVKATAPDDGEHYEDTDLTFKIVVEKKKLNPKLYSASGKLYINDNSAVYHPTGTFTLEYTIDGVEQTPITGIKYNTHFDWNPTKSGDYEYTIIYNEAAEKEYFIIDDFTTNSTIALTWGFKATGSVEGTTYKYGSEVALEAPATDPTKEDKPFYGFVKWEDANGNTGLTEEELSNKEISFTMPDGDVELNATYKFDFCLCIRYYIQIVVDWFNSFFQSIGTLF